MASSVSAQCAHPGCRRRVKFDNPFYPYCHDHRGQSDAFRESLEAGMLEGGAALMKVPSSARRSSDEQTAGVITDYTGLDSHSSMSLVKAVKETADGKDLSVPSNAAKFDMDRLMVSLEEHGMDMDRVRRVTVQGAIITDNSEPGLRASRYPRAKRDILVIQGERGESVVVDPSMSNLAPVWNHDISVNDQLANGMTPFGDVPLVTTEYDYINNGYVTWQTFDGYEVR